MEKFIVKEYFISINYIYYVYYVGFDFFQVFYIKYVDFEMYFFIDISI